MKKLDPLLLLTVLAAAVSCAAVAPTQAFGQTTQTTQTTQVAPARPDTPPDRSAMLGVSVSAPATGEGLNVEFVVPGSPAATMGLQVGDVLLRFDDQLLFHPVQLQKLIERSGPDHEAKVIYRRGTAQVTGTCLLATALASPVGLPLYLGTSDEVLKKALKDAGIPEGDLANLNYIRIGEPGNAVLMLNNTDDGWTLSIRDTTGKEIFSGPVNTEEDRAAVPEKYRSVLPLLKDMMK